MKMINPLLSMQLDCPECNTVTRAAMLLDPINSIVRVKCYKCLAAWAYEIVPAYQIDQTFTQIDSNKRKKRAKLERIKDENISDEKRSIDG